MLNKIHTNIAQLLSLIKAIEHSTFRAFTINFKTLMAGNTADTALLKPFVINEFSIKFIPIIIVSTLSSCGGGTSANTPNEDTTAPIITLNGLAEINLVQNDNYTDAGALANDDIDGAIVVTISGSVNTSIVATYTITYSATDSSNNTATKTRSINVIAQTQTQVTRLNDTGIIIGANYPTTNNLSCIGETIAQQDCAHGRDALAEANNLNKTGSGHAGFDFTKLDENGNPVSDLALIWSCVKDNQTGLVWEVKNDNGGIQDKDNTYRWGGITALINTSFNTQYDDWDVLVNEVNNANLCGFNDWKVPSIHEYMSIIHFDRQYPALDDTFFPNTIDTYYWTASPHAGPLSDAWAVNMFKGGSKSFASYQLIPIRLVRSLP